MTDPIPAHRAAAPPPRAAITAVADRDGALTEVAEANPHLHPEVSAPSPGAAGAAPTSTASSAIEPAEGRGETERVHSAPSPLAGEGGGEGGIKPGRRVPRPADEIKE